jgi:hypothetical protein
MIALSEAIIEKFKNTGELVDEPSAKKFPWANHVYTGPRYRRAHIDIVDAREDKKLWMMHVCIFPHFDDPSPIFGFDAVCGKNKVTGVFHDFSSAGDPDHFMINWFDNRVNELEWKKERELPDWARHIFSPAMVAVSNINTEEELETIINVCLENMDYYLGNVGHSQQSLSDFHMAQNRYCYYQKKNPHTPKVMASLGLDEEMVHEFIDQVLFPEVT